MKSPVEVESGFGQTRRVNTKPHRWAGSRLSGVLLVVTLGGSVSCGARVEESIGSTDTGNPPIIDSARVFARLVGADLYVEGEAGAVPGGATVTVEDPETGEKATAVADADGSFTIVMNDTGESDSVVVVVVATGGGSSQTTLDVSPGPASTAPDTSTPAPVVPPSPEPLPTTDVGEGQPVEVGDTGPAIAALGQSLPIGVGSSEVDWSTVDWANAVVVPFTEDRMTDIGLWMGTGVDEEWPVGPLTELPYPVNGWLMALHLEGESVAAGLDVYLHTAMPFEEVFYGVYFVARSLQAGGQTVRITVGGPYEDYWPDTTQGNAWPAVELTLGERWAKYFIDFRALGFDAEHLSPHSDPYGAVHFLVAPEQVYDFEVTDLLGLRAVE